MVYEAWLIMQTGNNVHRGIITASFHYVILLMYINSYSASHDNWCTVGEDGECRVGKVWECLLKRTFIVDLIWIHVHMAVELKDTKIYDR